VRAKAYSHPKAIPAVTLAGEVAPLHNEKPGDRDSHKQN